MRFLLDEDVDPQLAEVLRALRHEADHIQGLGVSGATDQEVARLASAYDVLVTMDLHRQQAEWVSIYEGLLSSIRIIRLRFPGRAPTDLMAQVRALVWKWSEWEGAFTHLETRLITIGSAGASVRVMTAEQIADLLEERST